MIAASAATKPRETDGTRPTAPDATGDAKHAQGGGMSFGEFVSCLNPLQYLPVIGTVYRAVTGNTIPEPIREAGSLVVSGLTGGPVGVALSAGMDLAERAVGFDQEAFGQRVLAWLGIGGRPHQSHGTVTVRPIPPAAATSSTPQGATPFTAAELASVPALSGADGLNGLELGRLRAAGAAYRSAATLGGTRPTA